MEKILGVSSELGKNCGNIGFFSLGSAISFSCTKELYCLDVFSSVFPLMTTSRFVCFAYFLSPGMPLFSGTRHSAAIQFSLLTHIPESVLTTRERLPFVCHGGNIIVTTAHNSEHISFVCLLILQNMY